jgi:hypothetical protein
MGVDIELYIPVERNRGKQVEIIKDVLDKRGITTYAINSLATGHKTGCVIDIVYPEPTCDHSDISTEKKHNAVTNDLKRPESTAVFSYGIFYFAVRPLFIRASMKDRWGLFFSHLPNREHDLECAVEIARQFSNKYFYLVPDESEWYCFPNIDKTKNKHFKTAKRHPDLVTVGMPSEVLYKDISLEDAIKKLYFKANKDLMRHLENQTRP